MHRTVIRSYKSASKNASPPAKKQAIQTYNHVRRNDCVEEERPTDDKSINYIFVAASELMTTQAEIAIDVVYGREVPIRSVHVDGAITDESGERRIFTIVFEYETVSVSEVLNIAGTKVHVSEFVKCTSFVSVMQAKKFIEVVANWVKRHDICDAFITRHCPDLNWTAPHDLQLSAGVLTGAVAFMLWGGDRSFTILDDYGRIFVYNSELTVIYHEGVVKCCYSVVEFKRHVTFDNIGQAIQFLIAASNWNQQRPMCLDDIKNALPEMLFD